jgi:hypothetical protein
VTCTGESAGVHVFSTRVLQRIDTGERRETYCWHCRKQTTRAEVRTHCDNPYFDSDWDWYCLECKRDTRFGESLHYAKPIEWEPVGTEFRMPEAWLQ